MALPFDLYTRYYNLLYRDKDYAAEADYVAQALRRRAPQARRVLELGCGTGGHAEALARLGFEVHGIDLSDSMVAQARARQAALPSELAGRLKFDVGDARQLRLGQGFDAVVSLFHVMSYQTGNADLQQAYATAHAHLAQGGVFLFDYWYGPAVLSQRPELRVRRMSDSQMRVMRLAEPVMHWRRNVCDVHYTMMVQALDASGGEGPLHQFQEVHPMRYLFTPELALFEGAHWQHSEDRAWLADKPPDQTSWAAMRVLQRA